MFSAATKSGKNATGGAVVTDPQFPLVTSLIHGDGTSGQTNNTFLDSSTNNFTITRNGNTTQGTNTAYNSNWSNYFDGTGDSLVVTGTGSCVNFGTSNFTIEGWCYISSLASGFSFFDTCPAGNATPTNRIQIVVNTAGAIIYSTYQGATNLITSANGAVLANQWTHVALVKFTNQTKLYVNGTQVGTTYADTLNYPAQLNRPILSANGFDGSTAGSTGYISNLRVVNGTAVYTANFTPPTAPLSFVSGTSLLTCQSQSFIDNSPNAFTITTSGDASVQRFSPFSPVTQTPTSYSGYFDGTGDYLTATGSTAFTLGTGDFTIECWFYTSVGTNNAMFQISNTAGGFNTSYVNTIAIGLLAGKINLYGVAGTGITSTGSSYATSTWTHVALVRSSGVTKLYINGALDTTVGTAGSITDTTSYTMQYIVVGGYYSTAYLWNGYVSNLRVVKGTAVYTSNFTVPTTPLTAISGTSFLTCQSTTFIDNSTNAFAITAFGDSKPRTQNPFGATTATNAAYSTSANGGSMYFDGTGDYLGTPVGLNTAMGNGFAGNIISIECWIYPTNFNQNGYNQAIIGSYAAVAANGRWIFSLTKTASVTTTLNFTYTTSPSAENIVTSTASAIVQNQWNHIAVTIDATTSTNTTIKLFANGTLLNTFTAQNLSSQTAYYSAPYIGFSGTTSYTSEFSGYISNLRILKGSLAYTTNYVPPQSPVTAITNTQLLLNGTNAGVLDNAMMGDYETVGTTRIVTTIKKFGTGSVIFNGTTDYFVTKSNQAYAFNTGNFTVEMWLYPTSFVNYKTLYGNSTSAANATGFHTGLNASGNVFIYSASAFRLTTSNAMTLNAWNYVAIVRSGSTITVYINGTSGGTWTLTTQTFTDGQCFFGAAPGGGSEFYTGYLDDFRITKGFARTVTSLPTAAFPNS